LVRLFVNAWKIKEIRDKILYTFAILAIIRLGAHIALPGISVAEIKAAQAAYSTGTLYNIIAGGYNSNWSIFALGIGPYITSSIIMQLLTVAIPKLEQLSKEGEEGRKKISSYSRYLTVVLAAIQAIGITISYKSMFTIQNPFTYVSSVVTLVAGTTFIMWLAEQITKKGITNGSSMVIFANIISSLPTGVTSLIMMAQGTGAIGVVKLVAILILLVAVIVFIVYVHDGERRIPVQYSGKMMGRKNFGGKSTYLPVKVNTAGVLAIIFAVSLLQFPLQLSQFFTPGETFTKVINVLNLTHPVGAILYVILIIFFAYFYTSIVINPIEIAENMKKNGGFIPGIRPGKPTSSFINRVVERVTLVGALCFAIIALLPLVLQWVFGISVGIGGTTLIIVVGVALDIVKGMESQLIMRHYKGFLD